jgi:hypothetical protein
MPLPLLIDEDSRGDDLWNAIERFNAGSPGLELDIIRVGDAGGPPKGTKDPDLLDWAIRHQRIIVSQDKNTLIAEHDMLVRRGIQTPGLLIIRHGFRVSEIVEYLWLVSHCTTADRWKCTWTFIP